MKYFFTWSLPPSNIRKILSNFPFSSSEEETSREASRNGDFEGFELATHWMRKTVMEKKLLSQVFIAAY